MLLLMVLTTHAALSLPGSWTYSLLEHSTAATQSAWIFAGIKNSWKRLLTAHLAKDFFWGRWVDLTRFPAAFLHSHTELLRCSLYRTTLESSVEPPANTSDCYLPSVQLFLPGLWGRPWCPQAGHPVGNKAPLLGFHVREQGARCAGFWLSWQLCPREETPCGRSLSCQCRIWGTGCADPTWVLRQGSQTALWGFACPPGYKKLVL